jgi:hypothetical protein
LFQYVKWSVLKDIPVKEINGDLNMQNVTMIGRVIKREGWIISIYQSIGDSFLTLKIKKNDSLE